MAWITLDTAPAEAGPAHAAPAAIDLLRAGVGIRFRLLDDVGSPLAAGLWLNTPDCEPADHPHRQPLADLAARHRAAVIEYEIVPGRWVRH